MYGCDDIVDAMLAAAKEMSPVAFRTLVGQDDTFYRYAEDVALSNRAKTMLDIARLQAHAQGPVGDGADPAAEPVQAGAAVHVGMATSPLDGDAKCSSVAGWHIRLDRLIKRMMNRGRGIFIGGVCPAAGQHEQRPLTLSNQEQRPFTSANHGQRPLPPANSVTTKGGWQQYQGLPPLLTDTGGITCDLVEVDGNVSSDVFLQQYVNHKW